MWDVSGSQEELEALLEVSRVKERFLVIKEGVGEAEPDPPSHDKERRRSEHTRVLVRSEFFGSEPYTWRLTGGINVAMADGGCLTQA